MNDPRKLSSYAWLIVGLLWPVALLNYLDRQMIASMKVSVMNDITDIGKEANWGYMLGQFKWVYAILSPIGGYIADRFSRKFTICASLFAWSIVTFVTGKVHTYEGLLWTRTAMGISEAFYIPAALAMIADYHAGGTRSRATSIHQIGIYCGIIAGGFTGYVADAPALGWRFAFNVTGIVGILYAPVLLYFLRDAPKQIEPVAAVAKLGFFSSVERTLSHLFLIWRELLTNISFILLVLYFTLPALAGWVVRDWGPSILKQSFNISQGVAGVSAAFYLQAASIVSAIAAGWLADRWMRRTPRGRIYVSAIGMSLLIPALFGVGNAPQLNSFGLAIAALIVFGIGWGFFDINNMPILSQIARPEVRATGYGLMNMVSISCGGFADWGFGHLQDRNVPLNAIFGAFASLCVISVVLVLLIRPRTDLEAAVQIPKPS